MRDEKIEFLHTSVKDFLATDDMMGVLDTRSGQKFNLDEAACHVCLIGIVYYYTSGPTTGTNKPDDTSLTRVSANVEFKTWPLLFGFYRHARYLEEKPSNILVRLDEILWRKFPELDGLQYSDQYLSLASMQVGTELDRLIRLSNTMDQYILDQCAVEALGYLLWPDFQVIRSRELIEYAVAQDPDRLEFNLPALTMLLKHCADPTEAWDYALGAMRGDTRNWSGFRKTMLWSVTCELIKAGARTSQRCDETGILEETFGRSKAAYLISLRGPAKQEPLSQDEEII